MVNTYSRFFRRKGTTKIAHTQIFERKILANRIIILCWRDEHRLGCLHTEAMISYTTKGAALLKFSLIIAYGLQDANVLSKGSPFMGEEVEVTFFLTYASAQEEKSFFSQLLTAINTWLRTKIYI